jgi:Flp pilus assembly protein TadD
MQFKSRVMAESLFRCGLDHLEVEDWQTAESCFRKAVENDPRFGEALVNLAFLLDRRGDVALAQATYLKAQAVGFDSLEMRLNMGALMASQKRFSQAESQYAQALQLGPKSSAVWSNLGALYLGMKSEIDAEACLNRALELDPANAKAKFNLSYLFLRQGRFDEGWKCFEARDWYRSLARHFTCPRWLGEDLNGQSIVIGYEAGHGDVIQFARYVPVLKELGAQKITLLCHPALKDLLQTLDGIGCVLGFDEDVPHAGWDYWTPLLSIPFHLKTRADTIPANIPYLKSDAQLIEKWGLGFDRRPEAMTRVGLVWKGNPNFENDAERSLHSARVFRPLWKVKGTTFVSLQKGSGESELASVNKGLPLLDLGSKMTNFADAAAIVDALDLVITVDTAMAHLCGALGRPCWVLLPYYMTDWRWGTEGSVTPWYPKHMRLFRQKRIGSWDDVIVDLTNALEELVKCKE